MRTKDLQLDPMIEKSYKPNNPKKPDTIENILKGPIYRKVKNRQTTPCLWSTKYGDRFFAAVTPFRGGRVVYSLPPGSGLQLRLVLINRI